ncbi:hypothetical protein COB72_07765 [bacterium]|nr:MAG: hypothetical protein COB72_07765 [bacterium]
MTDQQASNEFGYRQSLAEESRGSIPWFLLPFMFLIRPGKFMLSWGIHANIRWVLLAAWLIGSSGMINTVINRTRFSPDSLPIAIDTWTAVWIIILGFGILRGIIGYGIGGLWTWLRLRICGVRGNEWNRSTRIYNFSMLVNEVPSLLALAYFSLQYDTLRDFIAQPVSLVNLVAALMMLFAPVVAFVGVLACYKVRIVWATILFLLIPMSWRVLLLGSIGYSMLTSTGSVLLPDTKYPVEYAGDVLAFDHPKDWQVAELDSIDDDQVEVLIESTSDEASLLIRVQPRDELDLVAYDIDLLDAMGYTISRTSPEPNSAMGQLRGEGIDYDLEKDGNRYRMYHLIAHFDFTHDVLIRSLASERYWDASKRAVIQIVDSIAIGDLYKIAPDLEKPMMLEREVFSFQAPGNWHLGESDRKPFTSLEISAKQYSWFKATIHDRDMTAQEELDMYLMHSIDDQLVSHTPMNTWLGIWGVGVEGQLRESLAGFQQFKALYAPLADGRLLVIKMYQAESSAGLTDPGFELIESTFKLLVEPASPQAPAAKP